MVIIKLYIILIPGFLGTAITEERSSSSSVPFFSGEAISSVTAASPRTATLGPRGDQSILGRGRGEENAGDAGRGCPTATGFLYKYRKGEDLYASAMEASLLAPSEFVEHAGAGKVDNPLRHVVVSPSANL